MLLGVLDVYPYSGDLGVILTDLLLLHYGQFPKHCVFQICFGQWAVPSVIFI
jgi:hypothetical protein